METIVEVYRHVGAKVRNDLGKRNIPGSRMASLNARFDAIDAATNAVDEPGSEVSYHTPILIHLATDITSCVPIGLACTIDLDCL